MWLYIISTNAYPIKYYLLGIYSIIQISYIKSCDLRQPIRKLKFRLRVHWGWKYFYRIWFWSNVKAGSTWCFFIFFDKMMRAAKKTFKLIQKFFATSKHESTNFSMIVSFLCKTKTGLTGFEIHLLLKRIIWWHL